MVINGESLRSIDKKIPLIDLILRENSFLGDCAQIMNLVTEHWVEKIQYCWVISVNHSSRRRQLLFPFLWVSSFDSGLPSPSRLGLGGSFGFLQAIARQVQLQDHTVMDQAVDGRGGGHRILEDAFPL